MFDIINFCVISCFWILIITLTLLVIIGVCKRISLALLQIRLDSFARTLGWGNYGSLKFYITESMREHYTHSDLNDDYKRGLVEGANIAIKVVLRGVVEEINSKKASV